MVFCKVSVIQLCLALHHAFLITQIIACTSVTLIVTDIYTPHVCYERHTQCDSRNFHIDIAKPLISSPILSLIYTLTSTCLPFWSSNGTQIVVPPLHEQNVTAHRNKGHVNRNGQFNITVPLHTHANTTSPVPGTLLREDQKAFL